MDLAEDIHDGCGLGDLAAAASSSRDLILPCYDIRPLLVPWWLLEQEACKEISLQVADDRVVLSTFDVWYIPSCRISEVGELRLVMLSGMGRDICVLTYTTEHLDGDGRFQW